MHEKFSLKTIYLTKPQPVAFYLKLEYASYTYLKKQFNVLGSLHKITIRICKQWLENNCRKYPPINI